METKRVAFPRFYFLSNDELLEILSKANTDIEVIQQNLRTCFDNIMRLEIKDGSDIQGMISAEGEKITFNKPIKART